MNHRATLLVLSAVVVLLAITMGRRNVGSLRLNHALAADVVDDDAVRSAESLLPQTSSDYSLKQFAQQLLGEQVAPSPETTLQMADWLFEQGDYAMAIDHYRALLPNPPSYYPPYRSWLQIAIAHEALNETNAAIDAYTSMMQLPQPQPYLADAHYRRSQIWHAAGDSAASLRDAEAAYELADANVQIVIWYSQRLLQNGNAATAVELAQRAVELNPRNEAAATWLGEVSK